MRLLSVPTMLLVLFVLEGRGAAEPVRLRMSTIAPEGTGWAREIHAFSRDVDASTGGQVQLKWYFGGIAGDEPTSLERVRKGQLDGIGGSLVCAQIAPSLWVTRMVGLVRTVDESAYVLGRLFPALVREAEREGFVLLGTASYGSEILLSRYPVRSMDDFARGKYFVWKADRYFLEEPARTKRGGSTASSPFPRRRWPSSGRRKRSTSPRSPWPGCPPA